MNRVGGRMVWGIHYERSRSLWYGVHVRREPGLCNFRNRVGCEAMCGSLCCWNVYEVYIYVKHVNPFPPLYMFNVHHVRMWDDLTKNAFCIFKRVIAMTSSMQWPIFSYTISVWDKSLKRFKQKRMWVIHVEWFYCLKRKVTSRYGRYALSG